MKPFFRIKNMLNKTISQKIYVFLDDLGKIVLIGDKNCYKKLKKFSRIRTIISRVFDSSKRIVVVLVLILSVNLITAECVEGVVPSIPYPVIERRIKPVDYNHSKIEVEQSPVLSELKRSDKIQMKPFIRTEFKDLAPYIFLNGSDKHNFYKFIHVKGGFLEDYGGLIILTAMMICILASDTEAFVPIMNALQKLGHFNAPTPHFPPSPSENVPSSERHLTPVQKDMNRFFQNFNEPKDSITEKQRAEARKIINQKYPDTVKVTETERISGWQAVTHLKHAKGLGIDPEKYGTTQEELEKISKMGITKYVVINGKEKLPTVEHVKAYQDVLENFCKNPDTLKRTNSKYYYVHGITPVTVYYDEGTKTVVVFNHTNGGDLVTGDKRRKVSFDKFMADNKIGAEKWIRKWDYNKNK